MRATIPLALALALAGCQTPAATPARPQRTLLAPVPVDPARLPRLRTPTVGLVLGAGGPDRAQPMQLARLPVRVQLVDRQPLATSVTVAPPAAGIAPPSWQAGLAELLVAQTLAIHPDEYDVAIAGPTDSGATIAIAILAGLTLTAMPTDAGIVAELASDGTLVTTDGAPGVVASLLAREVDRVLLAWVQPVLRKDGKVIDLRQQVAERDVKSELVGDLTQAYRHLLGQPMPETLPSAADVMQASEQAVRALELGYT